MNGRDSQVLKDVFGIQYLREDQKVVVEAVRSGSDCVVVMRTGGGKSVCFLLPCLTSRGVTIVVSPLKAISHNQVENLSDKNIGAVVYDGEISRQEKRGVLSSLGDPSDVVKVLYTTPETLLSSRALKRAINVVKEEERLQRIVYDEAHCVVSWGGGAARSGERRTHLTQEHAKMLSCVEERVLHAYGACKNKLSC
jgi:ATP-dependent DNA helicase RecQ